LLSGLVNLVDVKGQQIYRTGLIALPHDWAEFQPSYKGAGWTAILVSREGRLPVVYRGREVAIRTASWFAAQRALDLIDACHELFTGDTPDFRIRPIAHTATEPHWISANQRRELHKRIMSTSDFPLACAIAARASRRRQWIYAAAQYHFSRATYAVHSMDIEPFRSPHLAVSRFPNDHVMFAHAIVAAYSVIENLGLEIRASANNPSRIGGNWNPVVLQDLEGRLKAAGVDLRETLLWVARGPKRKIEKSRSVIALRPAQWAGSFVRDVEVPVTEAIAYSDWLRDRVATHSVKDLTTVLSPYDVTNVQHLARRLFLESLSYWKTV
jgi:hypothetical protein